MTTLAAVNAESRNTRADVRERVPDSIAPRALGHAVLLGVGADLLLRSGIDGVGFPLWIATLALALTSLTWRAHRDVPRQAATWLILALLSACGLAWRDSEMLKVLDFLATAAALGMAAIALANESAGLLADRFRETLWACAAVIRRLVSGILPNFAQALREAKRDSAWESRSRRSFRSALLALGVLLVFGSLLRSADPIFASLVAMPDVDVGEFFSHVFLIGWFAWLVGGWANAALGSSVMNARAPKIYPFSLGKHDLAASLGVLNVLFAAFILAQIGWLFGGEQFLQARTGLTASEYARHGFFEVVWVATLVVPMLVISRGALMPGRSVARRHTMLAVPLLLLLSGIIASAATRMQLYVHYYGLTVDRLYTLVFMGWLVAVLMWLGTTVLRDRGRTFFAGVAASGLLVLAALNVASPDAIVARFNAGRVQSVSEKGGADLVHMTELSAEAVDVAIQTTLATPRVASDSSDGVREVRARCEAANNLMFRWGPSSRAAVRTNEDGAWRQWNAGERRAVRLVGASAAALRGVQHAACAGVPRSERWRALR